MVALIVDENLMRKDELIIRFYGVGMSNILDIWCGIVREGFAATAFHVSV